ncbi:MAG: C_GCAxxG_C_C family protein [Ruminococcus sp.]|nr:C_GCAxxG_C_C family protein [Ruminococcus sp.]
MTKGERARELFLSGYNCAQAVAGAFCEEMNMDLKLVVRTVSPFGGGFGRSREVCGTVSGMMFVLGNLFGYDAPDDYDGKKKLYREARELIDAFKRDNGSIICRELLGIEGKDSSSAPLRRTDEYYKKRPCPELCAYAADLLDDFIRKTDS